MNSDLFIEKKYARVERTEKEHCAQHGVRFYRSSPVDATLQIRSSTEKQGVYASVGLNAADCRKLAKTLLAVADTLSKEG